MSWTVDFGAWPQKWEELPEQIAVTNKETGEWDFYMLTSKAMRMIRDAKDDANWINAELHGAELEAEKAHDEAMENKWAREFLNSTAEKIRLANAHSLVNYTKVLQAENEKLRELVRDLEVAFIHGPCYRWCEFKEPCNGDRCQYRDRMRELGVEV